MSFNKNVLIHEIVLDDDDIRKSVFNWEILPILYLIYLLEWKERIDKVNNSIKKILLKVGNFNQFGTVKITQIKCQKCFSLLGREKSDFGIFPIKTLKCNAHVIGVDKPICIYYY